MSKPKSWEFFDRHFKSDVKVGVVTDKGTVVARVVFKHSRSNGTCYCCIHVYGMEPVFAKATGFGYDKKSESFSRAFSSLKDMSYTGWAQADDFLRKVQAYTFRIGYQWDNELERIPDVKACKVL